MAHLIQTTDKILTQIGESRAWHQLDTQIDFATDDWISLAHGHSMTAYQLSANGALLEAFGLISSANPAEILKMVDSGTMVQQPREIAEFAREFARGIGGRLVSSGTLSGTRRYFHCIEVPGSVRDLGGGDKLAQFVVIQGSYDSSFPFAIYLWSIRAVCNNTLPSATLEDGLFWSMRQSKNQRVSIDLAGKLAAQFLAIPAERKAKENKVIESLVSARINPAKDINRFAHVMADGGKLLDRILCIDAAVKKGSLLDRCAVATIDMDEWDRLRTTDMNGRAHKISSLVLEGMGAQLETARETAWGLLNGFTEFDTHYSKRESSGPAAQIEHNLFTSAPQKQTAMLLASAIANTVN